MHCMAARAWATRSHQNHSHRADRYQVRGRGATRARLEGTRRPMHHHRRAQEEEHQHRNDSRPGYGDPEGQQAQRHGQTLKSQSTQLHQVGAVPTNNDPRKADGHHIPTSAATAMEAVAGGVGGTKVEVKTHMLHKEVEDTVEAHHPSAGRKAGASAFPADRACADQYMHVLTT